MDSHTSVLYEDIYKFDLGAVHFTISCHIDDHTSMYVPIAEYGSERAVGSPIYGTRPFFEALRFAPPPPWLAQATEGYSTIYERPRGPGIEGRDPELVVVLLCAEDIRTALCAWAAQHPSRRDAAKVSSSHIHHKVEPLL